MCNGLIVSYSMSGMCRGKNRQFQHVWYVLWKKLSVLAWMECVVVWNVLWSKLSITACLECVVAWLTSSINVFSTHIVCHVRNYQFQYVWNVTCTSQNCQFQHAAMECVVVIIVSYSMYGMCCVQKIQCV
jgi:hypothetical protein